MFSCETPEEPDTTPPTVTITFSENSVSEVVSITCISTDNEGVKKVELWVNGVSTGVTDETEPYSLDWNTTTYDDGSYVITVRSYDTSDNTIDSNPISLTVDNSGSYPTQVDIISIEYQDDSFLVTWSQNNNDDFQTYYLYESISEDMSDKSLIYESNEVTDTSYVVTSISEDERRYYQVKVTDIFNLDTSSSVVTGSSFLKIVFRSDRDIDGDQEIYIMDSDGISQTNLTNSIEFDFNSLWTPDGDHIIFEKVYSEFDSGRDIFIMDSDGSNKLNLTNNVGTNMDPNISDDGEKIVFWEGSTDDIFIMNSDGSGQTNLTNNSYHDSNPDISSDGQKIVFNSRRTGNDEIFIMNSDGSSQIGLTNNLNGKSSGTPIFSPDGTTIIFYNNEDIYMISSEGGEPTNLTNLGSCWGYTFSDDGSKIVFHSDPDDDNNSDIYVINSDGSGLINLTNGIGNNMEPDISQDGQKIIFCSETDNWDIYLMDIDGSNQMKLTNNSGNNYSPKFQPRP